MFFFTSLISHLLLVFLVDRYTFFASGFMVPYSLVRLYRTRRPFVGRVRQKSQTLGGIFENPFLMLRASNIERVGTSTGPGKQFMQD